MYVAVMSVKRRLIAGAVTLGLVTGAQFLGGCSYDGGFRYPCQDPENWETDPCRPPLCVASGTCTSYLVTETTDAP